MSRTVIMKKETMTKAPATNRQRRPTWHSKSNKEVFGLLDKAFAIAS